MELNHKLFTNQDLDFGPFTPEEREFWSSLDPQERATLLTGNPLANPEYQTQLCHFHMTPATAAPTVPAALQHPSSSGGSAILRPVPAPSTGPMPVSTAATTDPTSNSYATPSQATPKIKKSLGQKFSSKVTKASDKI